VGWVGNGCGVSEYHSVAGLNAVDTIQKIGNSVISATSSPSTFSPIRRVRRVTRRRRRADEDDEEDDEDDEDDAEAWIVTAKPPL
jgi:hypothetical protein